MPTSRRRGRRSRSYQIPLYVIGRQSLFGYPYAHHRFIDPVTKDVYHPLIRRGPETADLELYQWDGLYDRWDEQPSGFAPYELARLTKDSGGIYFVLPSEEFMRVRQREQAYSITQLKEYLPEYDNRLTYVEKRNRSPLRQTLHAIVMEGKNFLYRRDFPIETQELVTGGHGGGPEGHRQAQRPAGDPGTARSPPQGPRPRAREALAGPLRPDAGPDRRLPGQGLRVSRPDGLDRQEAARCPRSQPGPDLMITWVVDHAREPLAPKNETAKKYAEAKRLLKEVIARHPKTPWADLAQDALNRGFSVQLNEWHHNPKYYDRLKYVPKY